MLDFFRNSSKLVNRFTLILATAGLLVALFAIAGSQSDTVSARTIVIPESDSTLSPAIASDSVDPIRVELNHVQKRRYYEGVYAFQYEGDVAVIEVSLIDPPPGGAVQDIKVNLATRDIYASRPEYKASRSDYSLPSSVTIPRGQTRVEFKFRALMDDDNEESSERVHIYAPSVESGGRTYLQTDSGLNRWIYNLKTDKPSIKVLGGVDHLEGTTVTVRVNLRRNLWDLIDDDELQLKFLRGGRVVHSVDIAGPLKNSTRVDVPYYLADDDLTGPTEQVNLKLVVNEDWYWHHSSLRLSLSDYRTYSYHGARAFFRVIDNDYIDEPPIVVVRPLSFSAVYEGLSKWFEVELTNIPESNIARDTTVTVNLATGSGTTASESDYSYPSSVTLPRGENRVKFEVKTIRDALVEDSETLNIYANSVDYRGYNYEQSDSGADLTIFDIDDDSEASPTVVVRPSSDTSLPLSSPDGIDRTSIIEGGELLLEVELTNPPRGGALRDITVHLATDVSANTAAAAEYSLPATVTILSGTVRGVFTVRANEDDLVENGETLNVYVSSVDYDGYNYEQSDSGLDLTIFDDLVPPVVRASKTSDYYSSNGVLEERGGGNSRPVRLDLVDAPKYGTDRPVIVHLATRDITTSESDYRFPATVTIPAGAPNRPFHVSAINDNLLEFDEKFNIYVSSVEYGGRHFKQYDPGIDWTIRNYDWTSASLAVQGGHNQSLGTTVTVRVRLSNRGVPVTLSDNSVQLAFTLTGTSDVSAVNVDGQTFVLERGVEFRMDITESLRGVNRADIPFYLLDDGSRGQRNLVSVRVVTPAPSWRSSVSEAEDFFWILDLPPVVAVRSLSGTEITEGNTAQLVVELTNAPEGGVAETITVHLETGSETTASETEYSYPSSVTRVSRATFEVSTMMTIWWSIVRRSTSMPVLTAVRVTARFGLSR